MKVKLESKQRYGIKQNQAIRVPDKSGIERGKKPVSEEIRKSWKEKKSKEHTGCRRVRINYSDWFVGLQYQFVLCLKIVLCGI